MARRLERALLGQAALPEEEEVEFGCSCRPIHCDPLPHIGALILRVPDPHCLIHNPPRLSLLDKMGADLMAALQKAATARGLPR